MRYSLLQELTKGFESDGLFHVISELTEIEAAPGINAPAQFVWGQPHGAKFINEKSGLSFVLQPNVLALRWTYSEHGGAYPQFESLLGTFKVVASRVARVFLPDQDGLPVAVTNMVYINFIKPSNMGKVLSEYFNENAAVGILKNAKIVNVVDVSWREEEDPLDLRFELRRIGVRREETIEEEFKLATAAGLILSEGADKWDAVCKVHERLLQLFEGILSEKAKTDWGMVAAK